jgi:CheY-like chemotaxis protein
MSQNTSCTNVQVAPLSILLVDDNPTNVLVGRRILEMLGYKDIPSATNGLEAFEMAEKTHYDVILMDLQMPVMDGYTSLERIMASPLTGQPCVVALTANADMVSVKPLSRLMLT